MDDLESKENQWISLSLISSKKIEPSEASLLLKQGGERLACRNDRLLGPGDAIVRYTGAGATIFDFVGSKAHNHQLIKPFKGNVFVSRGHIILGNGTLDKLGVGL
jgi:hypothetical protein